MSAKDLRPRYEIFSVFERDGLQVILWFDYVKGVAGITRIPLAEKIDLKRGDRVDTIPHKDVLK